MDDGETVGSGVAFPGRYVGSKVGDLVGIYVGYEEGCGVGLPGRNVGSNVGTALGAHEGTEVG